MTSQLETTLAESSLHKGYSFVILIASVAALAGILFGFDTGIISGAILYIKQEFVLTPLAEGFVVCAVLIGALLGCLVSGRLTDYFGRRRMLIITGLLFLAGTLISAFATFISLLTVGRIIVGIAIGAASFTAPMYISEIAPSEHRGMLVSLNQLAITVGIVLSYAVDAYFAKHGLDWRMMLGSGVIPAAGFLFGMLFLPRSPRWLVYKGHGEAAKTILRKIRGKQDIEHELLEIEKSIRMRSSWRLLTQKWARSALIIGLGLAFFQQCTGINTIIYYAPTIFEMAGNHSAVGAISTTLTVGFVNVGMTIVSLFLLDKWGRRPLLIIGLLGMALGLLGLSSAFYFGHTTGFTKALPLASMILYIACFAISLGPIMWLIISEIFPLEIRGLGSSIAVGASWGFNMIVTLTFLPLIHLLSASLTLFLYAIFCLLGLWFVQAIVPETKGIHLETIEANLRAGLKGRQLGKPLACSAESRLAAGDLENKVELP